MKKGDVGINASLKSTETRDELSTTCNPKVTSRCLSAPDSTSLKSLPPEPLWKSQFFVRKNFFFKFTNCCILKKKCSDIIWHKVTFFFSIILFVVGVNVKQYII